jgi:hypothetical protein
MHPRVGERRDAVAGEHDDRWYEQTETSAPAPDLSPQPEPDPLRQLASDVGNRAFARFATEGSGMLPGGRAHPQVEDEIARSRGSGSPLDAGSRDRFGPALGDDLGDVRVHSDDHADALATSVSARAFTTGSDVYFARGEYQPGSSDGDRLVAHELSHVVQQRGEPTTGPMEISEPGDELEVEAESAARELTE